MVIIDDRFFIIDDYFSIIDDCSFIVDDYLLLLMIICYCNKTNYSSSIYKVIRPVFNFFLENKISQAQSIYWFFSG